MNYYMPVRIIMEENCVRKNSNELTSLADRALIVTDGVAAQKSGALQDVQAVLEEKNIKYEIFDKVESNPAVRTALSGAECAKAVHAGMIIAIGGGSSIDAGKAIALLTTQDKKTDLQLLKGDFEETGLPMVAIPTTSGTGSEATPYAILTSLELEKKINMNSRAMFSKIAFLDPRYTRTMPQTVRIHTTIDAMSHAMESMLVITTNSFVEAIALEALRNMEAGLKKLCVEELSEEDRAGLMYACALAGMVVGQTRTSALHGISYPITYRKKLPHGRAVGLLTAPYLRLVDSRRPDITKKFFNALQIQGIEEFEAIMDGLIGEKEIFTQKEKEQIAEEAIGLRNIGNSIVAPNKEEILAILDQAGRAHSITPPPTTTSPS